jgi:hypothetical protein
MIRPRLFLALQLLGVLFPCVVSAAENYPQRPIRHILREAPEILSAACSRAA